MSAGMKGPAMSEDVVLPPLGKSRNYWSSDATPEELELCRNGDIAPFVGRLLGEREEQLLAALRENGELKRHAPRWIEQEKGSTHWEGCWQDHRNCALSRIAELERENREKDEKIAELEKQVRFHDLNTALPCGCKAFNLYMHGHHQEVFCGKCGAHYAYMPERAESEARELREQVARLEGK